MEETFTALRDKPCKKTVQASAEKAVQAVKAEDCQACSPKVTEGMRDFVELFARKVDETVSQVSTTPMEAHLVPNGSVLLDRSS